MQGTGENDEETISACVDRGNGQYMYMYRYDTLVYEPIVNCGAIPCLASDTTLGPDTKSVECEKNEVVHTVLLSFRTTFLFTRAIRHLLTRAWESSGCFMRFITGMAGEKGTLEDIHKY